MLTKTVRRLFCLHLNVDFCNFAFEMNNPFDYRPSRECEEAFEEMLALIEALKANDSPGNRNFCRELEAGKMLGVLIAEDAGAARHTLYAFSGQLGDAGFHYPGFVGPVFDYLQPDGYFKTHEADISRQNREIALFEAGELHRVRCEYETARMRLTAGINEYREQCRLSKSERKRRREGGIVSEEELEAMIRQSQFEKAELHRLKKRTAEELEPLETALMKADAHLAALKDKRRSDSEALQQWLFSNFRLLNARGESRTLNEIFAETPMAVPPSGAGECCAPKLLQEAYRRGWKPVAMAEYWYGKPKGGEIRVHGHSYPACRGKCLPVLRWMLQGLEVDPPLDDEDSSVSVGEPEILFENEWFCVVNKPSGMLSVPGKGKATSVQDWLTEKYGQSRDIRMVHRLDQDTSGLLIASFGEPAYKVLQRMFASRQVSKRYIAELEGDYKSMGIPSKGRINLPLAADWLDRPRQRVDFGNGKEAVTDYEFAECYDRSQSFDGKQDRVLSTDSKQDGVLSTDSKPISRRSRIIFHPHTGRTHQLRVHAASQSGLGMPIAGDRLYGSRDADGPDRLLLHAERLEFTFPLDNRRYRFELPAPF